MSDLTADTRKMCAACGENPLPAFPPVGALCPECEAVAERFTDKQWERVETMPAEQANAYLLKRRAALRTRLGEDWFR